MSAETEARREWRIVELEQAVLAYEDAVMQALRHAPNHWHEYRDPFELSPRIRAARSLARALTSGDSGVLPDSPAAPPEEEK